MSYHFAAEIPAELATDIQGTIARVRAADEPEHHAKEGADLILRLTRACLEAYYLEPVRALELGFVAEKATAVGIGTAHRAIAVFVRRIAGGFSGEQVLGLADMLETMLIWRESSETDGAPARSAKQKGGLTRL